MTAARTDESTVLEALRVVRDPDLNRDIVSLGFVKHLKVIGDRVEFTIELTTPACPVKDQMRDQARAAVLELPGISAVDVTMTANVRTVAPARRGSRAHSRRQEHHRRRRGQGRRGQDDAGRERRRGVGPPGWACGHDRRRHLRSQCAR